ncbi:MAG: MarR family transcriptional regulator [Ignavibacteriae bacterium]|nr:MarR family transcriptional regulator [Ignavibacteriota bacterium]
MSKKSKSELVADLQSLVAKSNDTLKRVHSAQLSAQKLTSPQFGVLDVLQKNGSVPLKKIGDELLVTGANITCVVDNLEKQSFVKRVPSKTDRRVINAELTAKGKQKLTKIYPEHIKSMNEFSKRFTDTEIKQLTGLLEKLVG